MPTISPGLEDPAVELIDHSHRGGGGGRGQTLVRINQGDQTVVVKRYGSKRSWFRTLVHAFGARWLTGKSSPFPRQRRRTECELLELWRQHGCDVPELTEPTESEEPSLFLEDLGRVNLRDHLLDLRGTPMEPQQQLIRRLAKDCGRRHAVAIRLQEPRLIHERPTPEHIMLCGERLVWCDLEVCYRRWHDIERLVSRELIGLLRGLRKCNLRDFDHLLEAFLDAYPDREALARASSDLARGSLRGLGWVFSLRRLVPQRDPYGKAAVARSLQEGLQQHLHSQNLRRKSQGHDDRAYERGAPLRQPLAVPPAQER